MTAGRVYIRLISRSPSILETPESDHFIEDFLRHFQLRSAEQTLSLWLLDEASNVDVPTAVAAYTRRKQDHLRYLRIPEDLLHQAGLTVKKEPDIEAFRCIQNAHYEIPFDQAKLSALALSVQAKLLSDSAMLVTIRRTSIAPHILELDKSCRNSVGSRQYETEIVQAWARDIVDAATK
ncbi:MAG: hypothetical protein H0U74_00560 [Bradymonadaceae bacterium]|nr:hypothetical protein [Lujinxingiaceae bacterium]